MDGIIVEGGARLEGEVAISGAKNAALPIMAATLLAPGVFKLSNVPSLADVRTMGHVLRVLGASVEPVDWDHPVFAGFPLQAWRYWNGDHGVTHSAAIVPMDEGVLAGGGMGGYQIGAVVAEYGLGDGLFFVSLVDAVGRYGSDCVATHYVNNLLEYMLSATKLVYEAMKLLVH